MVTLRLSYVQGARNIRNKSAKSMAWTNQTERKGIFIPADNSKVLKPTDLGGTPLP